MNDLVDTVGKRVFIFGAGSSISHSNGKFPDINSFFKVMRQLGIDKLKEFENLREYIKQVRGIDIRIEEEVNIEEIFTYLEIEMQIEKAYSPELQILRRDLLLLIQELLTKLEENIGDSIGDYHHLVENLKESDTVVNFNWDLLFDNILGRKDLLLFGRYVTTKYISKFYKRFTDWAASIVGEVAPQPPYHSWAEHPYVTDEGGFYLKMHGSIDWFYCSNEGCRSFQKLFPIDLQTLAPRCTECLEPVELLIIPPVSNKPIRQHPTTRKIWNVARNELRAADELIIWGYSLPPTDYFSSWLLWQARTGKQKRIVVIDPKAGWDDHEEPNKFTKHLLEPFIDLIYEKYYSLELFTSYKKFSKQ